MAVGLSLQLEMEQWNTLVITPTLEWLDRAVSHMHDERKHHKCREWMVSSTTPHSLRVLMFLQDFKDLVESAQYSLVALQPDMLRNAHYMLHRGMTEHYAIDEEGYLREASSKRPFPNITPPPRGISKKHPKGHLKLRINPFIVALQAEIKFRRFARQQVFEALPVYNQKLAMRGSNEVDTQPLPTLSMYPPAYKDVIEKTNELVRYIYYYHKNLDPSRQDRIAWVFEEPQPHLGPNDQRVVVYDPAEGYTSAKAFNDSQDGYPSLPPFIPPSIPPSSPNPSRYSLSPSPTPSATKSELPSASVSSFGSLGNLKGLVNPKGRKAGNKEPISEMERDSDEMERDLVNRIEQWLESSR